MNKQLMKLRGISNSCNWQHMFSKIYCSCTIECFQVVCTLRNDYTYTTPNTEHKRAPCRASQQRLCTVEKGKNAIFMAWSEQTSVYESILTSLVSSVSLSLPIRLYRFILVARKADRLHGQIQSDVPSKIYFVGFQFCFFLVHVLVYRCTANKVLLNGKEL